MRLRGAVLGLLLAAPLSGCVAMPGGAAPTTIDDVGEERARSAEARLEVLLESHGGYLQSRWPQIELPETGPAQWLDEVAWPSAYAACLSVRTSVPVMPDGSTGTVTLGRATSDAETRKLELAIYTCESILPPPTIAVGEPGPIETAWLRRALEVDLPRCLLGLGVTPGGGSGGEQQGEDPYARLRADPPGLDRAMALCPNPLAKLDGLPPAGRG